MRDTELARLFYAGLYADVLSATVDSADGGARGGDRAFVVGALAFVGRVVEAEVMLEGLRGRSTGARTLAAGAFFVAVALGRAGRRKDAARTLRCALSDTRRRRDAWSRGLLHQGVAALRFFAGDYAAAEQAARRALRNAQAAHFPYGLLLANDMRGHVLLRLGRFHEGIAVLERARLQAQQLDFSSNAEVIDTALRVQRAALAPAARATALLEEGLASRGVQDSYSRLTLLLELAVVQAYRGQASRARANLERATPLCAGSARARAAEACAWAHVSRVRLGWAGAVEHTASARTHSPWGLDPARDAEIEGLRWATARALDDEAQRRDAEAKLRSLAGAQGLARSKSWLALAGPAEGPRPVLEESLFQAFATARAADVDGLVADGWWGLLAEATRRQPAQVIHVRGDATLVEDRGDVHCLAPLAPRVRAVLLALAEGEGARDRLLAHVWGIQRYRPERHDPVIKTTVSRLRSALGPRGAWILTGAGGYGLRGGVAVVEGAVSRAATRLDPVTSTEHAGTARRHARWRQVLDSLAEGRELSVAELAAQLGSPVRTVSRDLSAMCDAALLQRVGAGRGTRYRASGES